MFNLRRPFSTRTMHSQMLIGESHFSLAGLSLGNSGCDSCRLKETPDPNVSIEEELHELRASQSFSSLAGETMAPTICPVPARDPSQRFFFGIADGGTT